MTDGVAWDPAALRSKAVLYFERAFTAEGEEEPELFAFWAHLALELLLRAAVAKINPALLAGPRRTNLLYGLGLDPHADPLSLSSAPTAEVVEICERLIDGFGAAEASICHDALRRRNAELHSAVAAMSDMQRGWRGRLFAACRVLADHLEITFQELFGPESAAVAERLIDEEAESVRKTTQSALEAARRRAAKLSGEERAKRERRAKAEFVPEHRRPIPSGSTVEKGRILRQVKCPACETPVVLRGEVVSSGSPRVDADGELVQTDVALPTLLECPVCELRLEGVSQLTQAGLGEPVYVKDFLDPVDTFDVDLSDYQDHFLESMSYREYEDE